MRTTIPATAIAAALLLTGCGAGNDAADTAAGTSTASASTSAAEGTTESTAVVPLPGTAEPVAPPATTQAPAPQAPAPSADAVQRTVDIIDFEFEPGTLTVPVGSTITWVQKDDSLHTVDFTDGTESGDLTQGQTYSRTFTEPGTYDYVCFYHPRMTATVVVE